MQQVNNKRQKSTGLQKRKALPAKGASTLKNNNNMLYVNNKEAQVNIQGNIFNGHTTIVVNQVRTPRARGDFI